MYAEFEKFKDLEVVAQGSEIRLKSGDSFLNDGASFSNSLRGSGGHRARLPRISRRISINVVGEFDIEITKEEGDKFTISTPREFTDFIKSNTDPEAITRIGGELHAAFMDLADSFTTTHGKNILRQLREKQAVAAESIAKTAVVQKEAAEQQRQAKTAVEVKPRTAQPDAAPVEQAKVQEERQAAIEEVAAVVPAKTLAQVSTAPPAQARAQIDNTKENLKILKEFSSKFKKVLQGHRTKFPTEKSIDSKKGYAIDLGDDSVNARFCFGALGYGNDACSISVGDRDLLTKQLATAKEGATKEGAKEVDRNKLEIDNFFIYQVNDRERHGFTSNFGYRNANKDCKTVKFFKETDGSTLRELLEKELSSLETGEIYLNSKIKTLEGALEVTPAQQKAAAEQTDLTNKPKPNRADQKAQPPGSPSSIVARPKVLQAIQEDQIERALEESIARYLNPATAKAIDPTVDEVTHKIFEANIESQNNQPEPTQAYKGCGMKATFDDQGRFVIDEIFSSGIPRFDAMSNDELTGPPPQEITAIFLADDPNPKPPIDIIVEHGIEGGLAIIAAAFHGKSDTRFMVKDAEGNEVKVTCKAANKDVFVTQDCESAKQRLGSKTGDKYDPKTHGTQAIDPEGDARGIIEKKLIVAAVQVR